MTTTIKISPLLKKRLDLDIAHYQRTVGGRWNYDNVINEYLRICSMFKDSELRRRK